MLALMIGIVSGTYTSILNASLLLYSWEHEEFGDFGRRWPATLPGPRLRRRMP